MPCAATAARAADGGEVERAALAGGGEDVCLLSTAAAFIVSVEVVLASLSSRVCDDAAEGPVTVAPQLLGTSLVGLRVTSVYSCAVGNFRS